MDEVEDETKGDEIMNWGDEYPYKYRYLTATRFVLLSRLRIYLCRSRFLVWGPAGLRGLETLVNRECDDFAWYWWVCSIC